MTRKSISKIAVNGARLIAAVSAIALAGSALAAGEATREFYRSLVPSQQTQKLPEECYDKFGKLVITPQNVELCSALPTAAIGVPGVAARDNDNDTVNGSISNNRPVISNGYEYYQAGRCMLVST